MHASQLIQSKWMIAAEFGVKNIPREPMVTIASVGMEDAEGEANPWPIIRWREAWAKPYKVNATARKALVAMFGDETDNWVGKRVVLFAMRGHYFGEEGVAVRIKGSPDIREPKSITVKKFGNRKKDHYTLEVIPVKGAAQAAKAPAPKVEVAKAATPPADATAPTPDAAPPAPDAAPPKPTPAPASPPAPVFGPEAGPLFLYGPPGVKGTPLERALKPVILTNIALGETKLLEDKTLTREQAAFVQRGIDEQRRELERRFKLGAGDAPPPPEPGSDG